MGLGFRPGFAKKPSLDTEPSRYREGFFGGAPLARDSEGHFTLVLGPLVLLHCFLFFTLSP